jgi:hypothetical protein
MVRLFPQGCPVRGQFICFNQNPNFLRVTCCSADTPLMEGSYAVASSELYTDRLSSGHQQTQKYPGLWVW